MVKSKILRIILMAVGFISLGLGCVGIALPIIPTVPFFLLTSYCFVKSSKRFNEWFLNSKLYKKYVENFATTRSMVFPSELILLLSVSGILMCGIWFSNSLAVSIILPIVMVCKYVYFIFRVKPISKPEYNQMMALRREKQHQIEVEKDKAERRAKLLEKPIEGEFIPIEKNKRTNFKKRKGTKRC